MRGGDSLTRQGSWFRMMRTSNISTTWQEKMGGYILLGNSPYKGQAFPFLITPQHDNRAFTGVDQLQNSKTSHGREGGPWPSLWKDEVQVEASSRPAEHLDWCYGDHNGRLFSTQYVHWCFRDMSGTSTWMPKAGRCKQVDFILYKVIKSFAMNCCTCCSWTCPSAQLYYIGL